MDTANEGNVEVPEISEELEDGELADISGADARNIGDYSRGNGDSGKNLAP